MYEIGQFVDQNKSFFNYKCRVKSERNPIPIQINVKKQTRFSEEEWM